MSINYLVDTTLQLTISQILGSTLLLVICLGALQWLLSLWIKNRLEQSIKHEYDKQLEEHKFAISKRDKTANIASFFSLWIKYRGHEQGWLKGKDLIEYYQKLTQMSFEFALWIDDEDLLRDVMKRLKNEDGSENTIELLLEVRKFISKNKTSKLKAEDITIWPADTTFIEDGER